MPGRMSVDAHYLTPGNAPHPTVLLRVAGDIDCDSVHTLTSALQALQTSWPVLDLTCVGFADSSLVHALLDGGSRSRLIVLVPLPAQLQRLFALTGTTRSFTFAPGMTAAHRLCPAEPERRGLLLRSLLGGFLDRRP